ncbi:MAG: prepilin peptidase [Methylocystis sp.]|nr:prepilin peptidase [Methylocystis sp.]
MIAAAAFVVFPMLMAFSAFADLFTMTIPNRVSLLLIGVFAALVVYLHMPWEAVALHVSCSLAVLLLTFVMFYFGWIGGGDAKLAATTALWLGWDNLLDYGLIASLIGGALTLAILAVRSVSMPQSLLSLKFVARLCEKDGGVPYGIALAMAGLLVYPHTSVWTSLAGV